MKPVAFLLVLLPLLIYAGVACGGQDTETETEPAPGPMATTETDAGPTPEPDPEPDPEPERETAEAPRANPTGAPTTAAAAATETPRAPTATAAPQPTAAPADTPTPAPTEAPEPTPADSDAGPGSFLVGEGSRITFTVEEETNFAPVRFDAVVSSTGLTGFANLDGSPSVIVLDLHSLESDQGFRDRYIRDRMFPGTPTATVTIDSLPDLPQGFFDGEETAGTLAGSLQIGESATPLTFDVEARHDGSVINVLGRTTFTWEQLGLAKPVFGPVTYLGDEVRVQVLIVAGEQ